MIKKVSKVSPTVHVGAFHMTRCHWSNLRLLATAVIKCGRCGGACERGGEGESHHHHQVTEEVILISVVVSPSQALGSNRPILENLLRKAVNLFKLSFLV